MVNTALRNLNESPAPDQIARFHHEQVDDEHEHEQKTDGLERTHQVGKLNARKVGHQRHKQRREQEHRDLLHKEDHDDVAEHAKQLCARIQPVDGGITREILAERNVPHQA